MLRISRYTRELSHEWDEFVKRSRNGTFLFQRQFMDYHSDRFFDHSVLVYNDNKIVALLPANQKANEIISHGGLTYGGLLITEEARLNDVIGYFYELLKYYMDNGIEEFTYKQIPFYYHSQHAFEDEYVMQLLKADLFKKDASFLLEMENEVKLQKGKKSNISRAKKENVKINVSTDYSTFWTKVLEPNLMEGHNAKPVHTKEEILLLAGKFPDNIKLFVAECNNELVGGTVLFINNKTVNVQYISASTNGKLLGALDYLFKELLEKYKEYKYFNFGTASENDGNVLNMGLVNWKEGFGARACSHNFYRVATKKYSLLEKYTR
ncbi:MAG TPA: GNAT family N-acetyltransferase [Bacteroidia bacterium]|jgi:hypothetical protein|nr:GNAT family N-acetyltransferase [Bacteroidia bacterium]